MPEASQKSKSSRRRRVGDIFVSYSAPDRQTAEYFHAWIEEAGLKPHIIKPGEGAGKSFLRAMNEALEGCDRLMAVYTQHYLRSKPCQAEIEGMWLRDPDGSLGRIIIVRLDGTEVPTLLASRDNWDFKGIAGEKVKAEFVRKVRGLVPIAKRTKRAQKSGQAARHVDPPVGSPGPTAFATGSHAQIRQAGRDFHEHHHTPSRPKVVLERFGDEIDRKLAFAVGEKLQEWGDCIWESSLKSRKPLNRDQGHEEARSRFRNKWKIPRYDALKAADYDAAVEYIRIEQAKLLPKMLKANPSKATNAYIGSIKGAMKKMGETNETYYPQVAVRLGIASFSSTKSLSPKNLKRVYNLALRDAREHGL